MLDIVSGKNEYKGKFEKIEAKDKDIYFASKQENFDNQESPSYISKINILILCFYFFKFTFVFIFTTNNVQHGLRVVYK